MRISRWLGFVVRNGRLAASYLVFNGWKTSILIACVFLTVALPLAIRLLLWHFDQKISARADATPVVIGASGSDLDLALQSLYFRRDATPEMAFAELGRLVSWNLATAIPLHVRFTARQFPIVGTTTEYLDFRGLKFSSGTPFLMLGECVLGAEVARRLELQVGDQLLSDRESVLDLAGQYPLKMDIVGVLQPSRTADDDAVFVDLKTAWVIQGLGHGHQDLSTETDAGKVLSRDGNEVVASAAVLPFTAITDENRASFHFHGEQDQFPITSIIALPHDTKSLTLLAGKYDQPALNPKLAESAATPHRIPLKLILPAEVFAELMNTLFRIKRFFDANTWLISAVAAMLLGLVIWLSWRLRQREMQTMFRLGCGRGVIVLLQLWELAFVFLIALMLVGIVMVWLNAIAGEWVEKLLLPS